MEASYAGYDFNTALQRIPIILNNNDMDYEEKGNVPARSAFTYDNGFFVSAAALFVDMRNSSYLSESQTHATLAKIYRTYISEIIAIVRGNIKVQEVYIEGDGVWAIFDTPLQQDIDGVFNSAAQISSIIDVLNVFYHNKNFPTINAGIGMAYGTSLSIQAGYKGSGINEIVWLGKVVGEAAHLSSYGNKTTQDRRIMISNVVYGNLNDTNKGFLVNNFNRNCYHGNVVNTVMNEWVAKNAR